MRTFTHRRPRYADVAATLALIVALGGTSYAVTSLPRNSVGTAQIKAHAITKAKLAAGLAIRGPEGLTGPPGPQGTPGAIGQQGPMGISVIDPSRLTPSFGGNIVVNAGAEVTSTAMCPAGHAITGGYSNVMSPLEASTVTVIPVEDQRTFDGLGWRVTAKNIGTTNQMFPWMVFVACA